MDDVVDFDGFDRPRKLRVDVNCISDYEQATGESMFESLNSMKEGLRLFRLRNLVWAMLKGDDKKLTQDRVGQLMNEYVTRGGRLEDLATVVVEAVNRSRLMIALSGRAGPKPNGEAEMTTSPTSGHGSASDS